MSQKVARAARVCLRQLGQEAQQSQLVISSSRRTFSTSRAQQAAAISALGVRAPIDHAPPTKPPSARPVETRKSQLIRTYTSLLRSTPIILFFQHSNLTAVEWAAVRRELKKAISAVPPPNSTPGVEPIDLASKIQLQVLRTNMLNVAFKIVELHKPEAAAALAQTPRTTRGPLVHDLSEAAYHAIQNTPIPEDSAYAQIEPLLVGPIAALTLPAVSPAHVAAALSVLAPVPGQFPAPTRKKNPGYHDPTCQNALAKLLLVGGRIEGKVFDQSGVNWVGGIEGGLDGLRAQLVGILQGAGLGVTNTLEGNSKNLWLALEGRKGQLEEEQGGKKEGE
ncbi:ribosomal protein YmL11 precursor, mitochondrial [Sarocladium implicatum]|nr:ribosomal protein YmL11 precursor, mitochondrial [Sarocladium implicatum]